MLTDKAVANEPAAPKGTRKFIHDEHTRGLVLMVTDTRAKSWRVNRRIKGGAAVKVTLGRYPALSLAAARDQAIDDIRLMRRGRDPRRVREADEAEQRRRDRDTFEAVAEDFIAKHLKKNRTGERDAKLIRRDLIPEWRSVRITEIGRRDIADLLDKLAKQRKGKAGRKIGGEIAANRRGSTIRKLFNWALARGIVESNPAARMEKRGEEKARDRVLSDYELRMIWRGAEALGGPFGAAIRVLMLTGKRRSEVARMRRRLADLKARQWTSLPEDEKSKTEHLVPLTEDVIQIIEALPTLADERGNAEWIFTTAGAAPISGWSKFKVEIDAKIAELATEDAGKSGAKPRSVAPWTLHDLRRTFTTRLAEMGVDQFVIQKCLNHTDRSIVAVHYNRARYLEQQRGALTRWAEYVARAVEGKPPGKVVALKRRSTAPD